MASFAQRIGKRPVRQLMQRDDLDGETRIELWNVIVVTQEVLSDARRETFNTDTTEQDVAVSIWTSEFKKPRDEMPSLLSFWARVKKAIFEGEWFDVLDLIEATTKLFARHQTVATQSLHVVVADAFNACFERCLVGYRFIGTEITPVDSTTDSTAVEEAQDAVSGIPGARHALARAVELLADRSAPDYPNSIKESISAVEAVVKRITGEGTLGAGLNKLEAAGLTLHPALKGAWSKMYGWTSDADGIRHAGLEAATADQALARYVLVTCSAFVSFLVEEGNKVKAFS
jgi:hypothetical protein